MVAEGGRPLGGAADIGEQHRGEHPVVRRSVHRAGDELFDRVHRLIHAHEYREMLAVVLEQRRPRDIRGQIAAVLDVDDQILACMDDKGGDANRGQHLTDVHLAFRAMIASRFGGSRTAARSAAASAETPRRPPGTA